MFRKLYFSIRTLINHMHLYLLMEEGNGHIEIKKIKGNLYAYYTVNKWDKRTKKEIIKARTIISLLYFVKLFSM